MSPTAVSGVREHTGGTEPPGPSSPSAAPAPDRADGPSAGPSWSSTHDGRADLADDVRSAAALEAVSRTLPAELSSVRRARDVVRTTLAGWRAEAIYDDVVLVASELVSNALRHGLHLDPRAAAGEATVELSLRRDGEHVICAVTDPSQEPPVRRRDGALAGSGHGLELVDSLSLCWGWDVHEIDPPALPRPRPGKSVWAVFPLRMAARGQGAA
jgi:anti-sigma regulatory factor (Ser/Thr protein kinase)